MIDEVDSPPLHIVSYLLPLGGINILNATIGNRITSDILSVLDGAYYLSFTSQVPWQLKAYHWCEATLRHLRC